MKQFLAFIRKEFRHVFRDPRTLLLLFGVPVMQITLFGFALTNEIKNASIVVLDGAHDAASAELIAKIQASKYFRVRGFLQSPKDIEPAFRTGKIKMAVVIPPGFRHDLLHAHKAQVQLVADASDMNAATTLNAYLSAIILDYQQSFQGSRQIPLRIGTEVRMLYNPQLEGAHNFVPGVMALVLMLVSVMMTAVSIVREKEQGTMEVLLVSPFKPLYVVLAKAIPYFALSLVNLTTILLLSVFLLGLPIKGSLLLLIAETFLFILTCLSLGLLVSATAQTQQTAMLISLMGMMLPTMLFTGFIFPIDNMPWPLQAISHIVPSRWFFIIVKNVMIKGLGIESIWKETLILLSMTLALLTLAFKRFNVRLG